MLLVFQVRDQNEVFFSWVAIMAGNKPTKTLQKTNAADGARCVPSNYVNYVNNTETSTCIGKGKFVTDYWSEGGISIHPSDLLYITFI